MITCHSAAEARAAIAAALRILKELGVELHPQKTRIVHVRHGFEFLGYKIKRGRQLTASAEQDPKRRKVGGAVCLSPREVDPTLHGSGTQRTRRRVPLTTQELIAEIESDLAGLGRLLQACPRPKALQPARPLDRATHLVASVQTVAQLRLETAAEANALRRVWACEPCSVDSFSCISVQRALRESCMRENRTCSLSGGRRPARKRASSDPTGYVVGTASEALQCRKAESTDRPSRKR